MKTLIMMVQDACNHLNINNMSSEDIEFLVSGVPTDIPWSEEGADFITGMVMGWDLYEQKRTARKETKDYKYTLWLTMYSDDDAEIKYDGNSYCWYSDKLKISKGFDTMKAAKSFILNKLVVTPGFKASEFTKFFLKECCDLIDEADFPIHHSYNGNQEYDFSLDMNS